MQMMGSLWNYWFLTAWKISEIPIIAWKITEFAICYKCGIGSIFNMEFSSVKHRFSVALHIIVNEMC